VAVLFVTDKEENDNTENSTGDEQQPISGS